MSFRCSSFLPLAKEQGVSVRTTSRRFRGFSRCVSCLIYLSIWKILYRQLGSSPKWIEYLNTFEITSQFFRCSGFWRKKTACRWRTEGPNSLSWRDPVSFSKGSFLRNPRRCVLPLACIHAAPSNCSLWATSMQSLEISLFPASRTRSGPPAIADFGDPNGMNLLGGQLSVYRWFPTFWKLTIAGAILSWAHWPVLFQLWTFHRFQISRQVSTKNHISRQVSTKNKCQKTPKTNETIHSDPTRSPLPRISRVYRLPWGEPPHIHLGAGNVPPNQWEQYPLVMSK